ncbi:hypothetical protein [Actinacidiphila acididurans]|uniref:DNA primase n=1 Tax=Actinacidiphila acididurans TaxID=2784346 RepID=A0ABS2TSK7_9ACTN|nr:hypothetical protein [Actinacidiphila acididurans]MBM9506325.1 hypothetical protein [Actinacidiphila acididurans]
MTNNEVTPVMMTNAKIGVAVVGGYMLGRTKKAKLALGLGMFLAGKKFALDGDALRKALGSPVIGELNGQVREQIVDATRTAAKEALTKRVGGIADSLHERSLALNRADDEDDLDDAEDDEPRDDGDFDDADEPDDRAAKKSTKSGGRSVPRSSSGGTGKARRTASAAGKAAGGKGRSTSRTTTRAADGAGKAASGAAKRTSGGAHNA